jgi:hypothetical protein
LYGIERLLQIPEALKTFMVFSLYWMHCTEEILDTLVLPKEPPRTMIPEAVFHEFPAKTLRKLAGKCQEFDMPFFPTYFF